LQLPNFNFNLNQSHFHAPCARRWREKKAEENRRDSVAGADLIISNSSNQQQTTTDYCGHKAISAFDRSLLRTSCNEIIFLWTDSPERTRRNARRRQARRPPMRSARRSCKRPGEMRVEKSEGGWRVFVVAGGEPRGGATAADCALVAVGAIEGNTFQGEIKYLGDEERDFKTMMVPDHAVRLVIA
jgi:hypothetical protein